VVDSTRECELPAPGTPFLDVTVASCSSSESSSLRLPMRSLSTDVFFLTGSRLVVFVFVATEAAGVGLAAGLGLTTALGLV